MKSKCYTILPIIIIVLIGSCTPPKPKKSICISLTEEELQKAKTYTTIEDLEKANPDSVFKIKLDSVGLTEIPDIVYRFPNLQKISLEGNEIKSIQPEIKQLDLQSLQLTKSEVGSLNNKTRIELAYIYKNNGEIEQYNQLINDTEHWTATVADELEAECVDFWGRPIPPWEYSRTEIGFVPTKNSGDPDLIEIKSASAIPPDLTLKDQLLNINLAYLVCYDYPAKGQHNAFFGYNASPIGASTKIDDKDFSFNQNFIVNESDEPALKSIPIFNGLGSGTEGVKMNCVVYNVSNKNDQKVAQVFNAGKKGLDILQIATPAVSIVSSLADEALKIIQANHNNIPIHNVELGLHFNDNGTDLQLRQGTYIAMSVPNCVEGHTLTFNWSDYTFNRTNGKLQKKNNSRIKQNYIVFTISKK